MNSSSQKQGLQKTSYEGYPPRVGLEIQEITEAHSLDMAEPSGKTKSETHTDNLLERIVQRDNMNKAMKRVIKNKGSHGIDGMKIEDLRPYLMEHGKALVQQILAGEYEPQPVRRVDIPKPDGGTRGLGIPVLVDRVIQQAIAQVLSEIYEPIFSESSYGFRPGRNAHMALKQAQVFINDGYKYVVDMDLEKFFDRVNHDILMSLIARKVSDGRVLGLIRKYLNAGLMKDGVVVRAEDGVPQGGPLSPLLSNIMLDVFDKELERRGHKFCRYADDCNIYVKSRRAGERVMQSMRRFLKGKLKLMINEEKSAVASPTKRKFLGYSFYTGKKGYQLRVHPKSIKKIKNKIRDITNRNRSMNFEARVKRLIEVIRGWVNYFKLADMKGLLKELDEWTRRRLRACIWKTWKRIKTRFECLFKLGIPKDKAWEFANTRKGYWRISGSPIMQRAVTNTRLENRGFISMSALYEKTRLA